MRHKWFAILLIVIVLFTSSGSALAEGTIPSAVSENSEALLESHTISSGNPHRNTTTLEVSVQGFMDEVKLTQSELPNCWSFTGPLTAGMSSTLFSTGTHYKEGTKFVCAEMYRNHAIGVGDFNNDDRDDVALTWSGTTGGFLRQVYIFLQDTAGNLSTIPVEYTAGDRSDYLAVGDLNNDGLDDFATADLEDDTISVFIQQANGAIVKTVYPVANAPDSIAIGDVNNDGLNDVAVPFWGTEIIGILTQNHTGTLNEMVTYPSISAGYDDIAIGDVNHDGLNDVVKLNGQATFSDVLVYLQNENGQLNEYIAYSLGGPEIVFRGISVAIGDITGDSRSDIVVSYASDWSNSRLAVFAQDSSGGILSPVSYLIWSGLNQVEIADINSDNRRDVVITHQGWQNVGVLLQRSDGILAQEILYPSNYSEVLGIATGDLNSDGLIDLAVLDDQAFDVLYKQLFSDLSFSYWAYGYISRLARAGITGGCSVTPLNYCPESSVTRAQMAVFLLRGIHGSSYNPPSVGGNTGFGDVPTSHWAAAWIKQLAAEGITGGCGSGLYCPEGAVTRAQMAIFLLRSKYGAGYNPPGVGGGTSFTDVPTSYWAASWIKQLVAEGITSGCSAGSYCPESPVTRAQMAVFLVRTFGLP